MTRKSTYFKEIERLLELGYEPKHIMKMTNISKATVYRIVDKLRTESRVEFSQLMEKDYLWKYQNTIANFSKTITQCNEEILQMRIKYDAIELQTLEAIDNLPPNKDMVRATLLNNLTTIQVARTNELQKMVTSRDKASDLKAKVFNAGPVVHAIDDWIRKTNPASGEEPRLGVLSNNDDDNALIIKTLIGKKFTDKTLVDKTLVDQTITTNTLQSDGSIDDTSYEIPAVLSEEDLQVLKEMEI